MKNTRVILVALVLSLLAPLALHAQEADAQAEPHYYVPLVQLSEEEPTPGYDGPEAGIMFVEIGMETDADGNSPIFWSLSSEKVVFEFGYDGPVGPGLEEINPKIFNEAYRRYASDPRSAKATVNQTKQMLTKYYRQVEAEQNGQEPQEEAE